ncbi:hypothetical protein F5876DRAFT_63998 [Lentinula aff. lateritia]|uniref:Uncharacterized protein n=1 Tax=Lentinula aff. lateritia TaxID=2804960 RepID=A0ACC1U6J0_9AGAR|nr:hypothetical protein F5876DRAFT_63998 [Lentinula aff. lateritia]
MRFHTVIVISSFLATVFAAPHIQQKYDMNTSLEPRVYHAVATTSKTSGQPSATAKPGLAEILYNEEDVGKKTIRDSEGPDWELEYFNYSLKYYKGQNDLILREFGKDRLEDFLKEVEKVKAAKRYVDSGIHYDSTSVPKLFRPYTYVIILTTSKAGMSFLEDPSDDESPGAMGLIIFFGGTRWDLRFMDMYKLVTYPSDRGVKFIAWLKSPMSTLISASSGSTWPNFAGLASVAAFFSGKTLTEFSRPVIIHYFEEDPEVQTQTFLEKAYNRSGEDLRC